MAIDPALRVDIAAEFVGKKAFDKANTASLKLEKNVKRLGKQLVGVFAVKKIINFGEASVKAFAADDAAAKSLGKTLQNLGLAYGSNVGTLNGFIARLEKQTGVLDDELRPAMDRLLRATGDVTKSQELLGLALDVAAGTGKSVTQVSQSLQKAYLGQTQALGRLGVGLSKAELSTSSFEEIQIRLNELFAGQATTAANSYQGSLNKLTVAGNNAKETIGKGLVDALGILSGSSTVDPTVSAIDRIANSIANATTEFAKFIKVSKEFLGTGLFLDATEKASLLATRMGTRFTTPMSISSQDTQKADNAAAAAAKKKADAEKKAAAARLAADKKAAAAKIALDKKAAENALKLKKAESIFDLDKIQIEAALKGKISADEKLRLELQRAILNEDFTLANKLQTQLEASQRATGALQGQLSAIKPATDPFAEWIKSLEEISKTLTKILGTPINLTSSSMVNPNQPIVATQTPNSIFQKGADEVPVVITDPVIIEPPATNNSLAGLGGNTGGFGFSLPSYLKDTIPQGQTATTINIVVEGNVLDGDDFTEKVNDALLNANRTGLSRVPAGFLVKDD